MLSLTLAKRGSIFLFLALTAFYLYGLGDLPLLGPDEPRYAEVAREMLLRHDLITPTLGGHLWFEKPALLYWMMIAAFKLFGVSEWTARVGPAVSGLLTITAVFWIGRRVELAASDDQLRGFGFWSAMVAATNLGIVAFSRAASFDIVITMTSTWALSFFIVSELEQSAKRRPVLLVGFYVAIGFSLLAKGLVGFVIPFGVAAAYYVLRGRGPDRTMRATLLWGFPLALLVSAIWYAPMIWRHGSPFIDQFIIQHHFARYVTNKYHHPAPVYYYLVIILILTLPWTAFLIDGVSRCAKRLWRRGNRMSEDPVSRLLVFALAWIALPLIFFSFSSSKLPGYILPVLPAASLIVGERLVRYSSQIGSSRWATRITAVISLVFAGTVVACAQRWGISFRCGLLLAVLPTVAGVFALLPTNRKDISALLVAAAALWVIVIALNCAIPRRVERDSTRRLLQLADARGYSAAPVYELLLDDRTAEFYASGRVVYESDGEPVKYEGPDQIAAESRRRRQTILVMLPLNEVNRITQLESVRVFVIGNNGKVALLAVAPV